MLSEGEGTPAAMAAAGEELPFFSEGQGLVALGPGSGAGARACGPGPWLGARGPGPCFPPLNIESGPRALSRMVPRPGTPQTGPKTPKPKFVKRGLQLKPL